MRHLKSGRQLNRNSSHRKAMFRNMAVSLFRHEIIRTTLPKAKELRRTAEPLITLAKNDSASKRRLAFDRLRDREVVTKLFNEIASRARRLRSQRMDTPRLPLATKEWRLTQSLQGIPADRLVRELPACYRSIPV